MEWLKSMAGWIIAVCIYLLVVASLSVLIAKRKQPIPVWVATKELAPGHPLVKGDLVWPEGENGWGAWSAPREEWEGKYSGEGIKTGNKVDISGLLLKPIDKAWHASRGMKRNRGGPISLDRMFHFLSGASRYSTYAAVRRVGRLSKYTSSGV